MGPDGQQKVDALEETPEDLPVAGNKLWLRFKRLLRATGGLLLRPKHFLQAGVVKLIDGGSGLLQWLRKRAAEPTAEKADERNERTESRGKRTAHEDRSKEAPAKEVATPRPPSAVHSVLLYLLVLLVGAIGGMTFSFALLSTMVFNQAQRIDDQRDEIGQLERQQSKLTESEARYRKENGEYRQRLSEIETLAATRNAAKDGAAQESGGNSTASPSATPAVPRKTGNCNLEAGNIGNNLSRCVDEFNRK